MGLDQYVWAVDEKPEKEVDFEMEEIWAQEALAYFRKHPNLHGAIREIYRAKGGSDWLFDEFSGPVVLSLEDLQALEKMVREDALPHTTGFFFGESTEDDKPRTLAMIEKAKVAIADGQTIIYDSSW